MYHQRIFFAQYNTRLFFDHVLRMLIFLLNRVYVPECQNKQKYSLSKHVRVSLTPIKYTSTLSLKT